MPLSKAICKKCNQVWLADLYRDSPPHMLEDARRAGEDWGEVEEEDWDRGKLVCISAPGEDRKSSLVDIHGLPPSYCPHIFEQCVAAGMSKTGS